MKIFLLLLIGIIFLSSCSFEHWIDVHLLIPEQHPYEVAFSETLWFSLSYFDGEKIVDKHIPKGKRTLNVRVKAGSLAVFSFRPLGELGALGGFFEPGDDHFVTILPEYGSFAEMLLRAAEYRSEPVSRLSMKKVLSSVPDLQAVDESSFLLDIFNGTLGYGISLNEKTAVRFDSIPRGEWISERYDIPSFSVAFSGDVVSFMLYPGVYRYVQKEMELLLTIILDEKGDASMMISRLPLW